MAAARHARHLMQGLPKGERECRKFQKKTPQANFFDTLKGV